MTPAAAPPAHRAQRPATPERSTGAARAAVHRSPLRPPPPGQAPRAPRRVSGPAGGLTAPRRVPRPSHPAAQPRPGFREAGARAPRTTVGARAVAFVRALPDHPLLDQIVRGRAWIPILGILLAGIVAMQVEVLKLGARTGASIERTTYLQSRNELLRASVATLADDHRIESLAAGMGMIMPAPDAVTFLAARRVGYVGRAAASIHPPSSASFLAALPAAGPPPGAPISSSSPFAPASPPSAAAATAGPSAPATPVAPMIPVVTPSSSGG